MKEDDVPTEFLGGKSYLNGMFNGNTKPILKILLAIVITLTLVALVISANWGSMFRESGVTIEMQRANAQRIEHIQFEIEEGKKTFVTKEQFDILIKRMDALEANQQKMIQLMLEERRR